MDNYFINNNFVKNLLREKINLFLPDLKINDYIFNETKLNFQKKYQADFCSNIIIYLNNSFLITKENIYKLLNELRDYQYIKKITLTKENLVNISLTDEYWHKILQEILNLDSKFIFNFPSYKTIHYNKNENLDLYRKKLYEEFISNIIYLNPNKIISGNINKNIGKVNFSAKSLNYSDILDQISENDLKLILLSAKIENNIYLNIDDFFVETRKNFIFNIIYSYKKICSLINLFKRIYFFPKKFSELEESLSFINNFYEIEIIKRLSEWPEIISYSYITSEPNKIINFLKNLSNQFYIFEIQAREEIDLNFIIKDNIKLAKARFILLKSIKIIMEQGLTLLNITNIYDDYD